MADNWLEQECQALYRFLTDCWEGTGRLEEDGTASNDFRLWRDRAAEMTRQARAYGRSERIREALDGDPSRSLGPGVGDYLNAMCEPGYVFDPEHAVRLRQILAIRRSPTDAMREAAAAYPNISVEAPFHFPPARE